MMLFSRVLTIFLTILVGVVANVAAGVFDVNVGDADIVDVDVVDVLITDLL